MIRWIYSRDEKIVQYSKINQCHTPQNKRKDKKHVITSIGIEKKFNIHSYKNSI